MALSSASPGSGRYRSTRRTRPSSLVIVTLAVFFDLSSIAAIGAVSMLIIHMTTHIGHLRLLAETRAARSLVLLAVLTNAGAIFLGGYHLSAVSPWILAWIGGFFVFAFGSEVVLHHATSRDVIPRSDGETN